MSKHMDDTKRQDVEKATGRGHSAHYSHATGLAVVEQSQIIPMTGERKVTKRSEIVSYCLFYIAITGLGPFNYMPAQLQNLLTQAFPSGFVEWGGQQKSISALILDLNGIQFAVQLVLLLVIGPYADYGTWRPYILIVFTIVSWGVGFGWLGLETPDKWQVAAGLYVVATVCFNLANTFYFSAFPGLVRDLPKMIESEQEVRAGTKSAEQHAELDMRERSKLSNYSLATSAFGSCAILVLGLAICFGIGTDTLAQNTKVYSVLIGYFTAVWVVFSMPWFLTEQYRPGQRIPKGTNYLLVGPRQLWQAVKSVWQLKWTFLYLLSFFLLNDVYNVSGTAVNLLQNDAISFNTKQFTYLFILAFGAQGIGAYGVAVAQRFLGFSAKTGCIFGASCLTFTCLWGFIGIFTNKIGYHHVWEFYFYQAFQGVGVASWNTYQNTVISEVVPAPKMYLFFALFYIVGKTSAFIGPFIASAIIDDAHGNTSAAFWFLFFSGLAGVGLLALVNIEKAKIACAKYLEREAAEMYGTDELTREAKANELQLPPAAPFAG